MSNNYPDIAQMMAAANNPDLNWDELQAASTEDIQTLHHESADTSSVEDAPSTIAISQNLDQYWQEFIDTIGKRTAPQDKGRRVFCQLNRDIADSIDECDIYGRCRSDIVNTIVRVFFETFLPRLADFKRERKSFFDTLKTT